MTPSENNDISESLNFSDDIQLNTSGSSSIKTINGVKTISVKSDVKNDYLLIDFADISFQDFLDSNHTELKIAFDVVGIENYVLPFMDISLGYSGLSEELDNTEARIAPTSTNSFSCVAASKSSSSTVLGTFDSKGTHTFEYLFSKLADGSVSLQVSLDDKAYTEVYTCDFSKLVFTAVRISLKGSSNKVSLFGIDNLSIGYVPSLSAYAGEAIVIPTDKTVSVIRQHTGAIDGIANHSSHATLGNVINGELSIQEGIPINAFASIYLDNNTYKSYNVFDYDYMTIEYEVSVVDGESPFGFRTYLLGRPNGVVTYKDSIINFHVDDGLIYAVNNDGSHMCEPASTVKVKYIISGGHLQMFLNDVLYFDDPETFNVTFNCIEEIRINGFVGAGTLSFKSAVINVYT